tara:strand:+ start:592 stop:783 length:192 start_codon:yes stop_codon:yes gene_type:complete
MSKVDILRRLIKIRDKVEAAYGIDASDLWNVVQGLIEDIGEDMRNEFLELQEGIQEQAEKLEE